MGFADCFKEGLGYDVPLAWLCIDETKRAGWIESRTDPLDIVKDRERVAYGAPDNIDLYDLRTRR